MQHYIKKQRIMKWSFNYLKVIAEKNIKRKVNTSTQSLLMGVVKIKENLLMGAHKSMLVTYISDLEIYLQAKFLMSINMNTL